MLVGGAAADGDSWAIDREESAARENPRGCSGHLPACYAVWQEVQMDPAVSFPEGWTAPPELAGPLPRTTRISEDGRGAATRVVVLLLASIVLVVLGCIGAAQTMTRMEALRLEGRETTGEVTALRHRFGGAYGVRYAFNANGRALEGVSEAPKDIGNGLREAAPLPILFLPSNPAINHPAAWQESGSWVWDLWFVPMMPVAAAILVLTQMRRQRRLVAGGVPTAGIVTKRSRNSQGAWWVDYQFHTEDGKVAKGRGHLGLEIGATICVLYLPQDPRRNQPYLRSWYRVVW
jgi:hypothetical protein